MDKSKQILNELRNDEKSHKKILKQLVIERIKETSENKFKLNEIKYWSEYFNVSMTTLIFEILQINRESYKKLLRGQIIRIESNVYIKVKNKVIENKKKKYLKNRNLNRRNYYNKEKLINQAEIQNINIIDFTIDILGKSRASFRKVLKDEDGKKKLYIGRYINAKLPRNYIEKNSEELYAMSKINIDKVALVRGISIDKEDKEDLIQDCISYIIENGNMLDKKGNPIIVNEYASRHNKNKISKKVYYYVMHIIENYMRNDTNSEYMDNIGYRNSYKENLDDEILERCIYENISDKMEQKIFLIMYRIGNNEYTKQYIANKYKLKIDQIDEILDRNRKIIRNKENN